MCIRDSIRDSIPQMDSFDKDLERDTFSDFTFPEYYSTARVMGGLKNGVLYQGNIQISEYNFLEGSVSLPRFSKPVLIVGQKNLNRAFNGDQVIVELLPQSEWKAPSSIVLDLSLIHI